MTRKGLIHFRCRYCNRKLVGGWDQVGERRTCNCGERYRVPRYPGLAQRDRTPVDWCVEFVVYGFGGGLLSLFFAFLIVRFVPATVETLAPRLLILGAIPLLGFLGGGLFGERGINWIGSIVRQIEE